VRAFGDALVTVRRKAAILRPPGLTDQVCPSNGLEASDPNSHWLFFAH
jgi:hypothetical protein